MWVLQRAQTQRLLVSLPSLMTVAVGGKRGKLHSEEDEPALFKNDDFLAQ